MKEILTVRNLAKEYFVKNSKEAVKVIKGIDLSITEGEKVGYVGLNGAGKSTTIKMLTGLIKPTGGEISILGFNPFEERKNYVENIGVIFGQRNQLFWDLRVEDSFIFNKSLYKLSLGQKMKCNIALSLLHSPKILFLDEATIGLDLIVKNEIKKLLNEVNREFNTTMLFTSHDMKDIEDVCERIIILEKGNILHDLPLKDFRKLYGGTKNVKVSLESNTDLDKIIYLSEQKWANKFMDFKADREESSINFSFNEEKINIFEIMEELKNEGIKPTDFTINSDSLEDIIRGIYR